MRMSHTPLMDQKESSNPSWPTQLNFQTVPVCLCLMHYSVSLAAILRTMFISHRTILANELPYSVSAL